MAEALSKNVAKDCGVAMWRFQVGLPPGKSANLDNELSKVSLIWTGKIPKVIPEVKYVMLLVCVFLAAKQENSTKQVDSTGGSAGRRKGGCWGMEWEFGRGVV